MVNLAYKKSFSFPFNSKRGGAIIVHHLLFLIRAYSQFGRGEREHQLPIFGFCYIVIRTRYCHWCNIMKICTLHYFRKKSAILEKNCNFGKKSAILEKYKYLYSIIINCHIFGMCNFLLIFGPLCLTHDCCMITIYKKFQPRKSHIFIK